MVDSNAYHCCCTPCADGGTCTLPHNHAGEHYSDKEVMLDFLNPARHEIATKDAEIARLKAEVERQRCEIERLHGECVRRLIATTGEHGALNATEIARLHADLARHKRALAAGPARLRALRSDDYSPGYVAGLVETAQDAAMKEEP